MPAGRASVRNMIRDMAFAGDEGFGEALLALIKGGSRPVTLYLEELARDLGEGPECLVSRTVAAISANPMRYLEAGLQSLPSSPELDGLMSLLGPDRVRSLALRYASGSAYGKTLKCADWLLRNRPEGFALDSELVLAWADAWLQEMSRCACQAQGGFRERSEDVELYLLEISDGGCTLQGIKALELLATLYKALGRTQAFGVTALELLSKAPEYVDESVGRALSDAIFRGDFGGGALPPPPKRVMDGLRTNISGVVARAVQSQLDSIAQIVDDLLSHADSIQEWNEWVLTERGFGLDFIAGKIVEEASAGHRRAVALTRHLQTAEEAELTPCDIYPLLLETLAFAPSSRGFDVDLELQKDLPKVLGDEGLLKIGFSEFLAFLTTDVAGVEQLRAVAQLSSDGNVDVSLSVTCTDESIERQADRTSVLTEFATSLSKATLEKVVRAHGGGLRWDTIERGVCFVVRLPIADAAGADSIDPSMPERSGRGIGQSWVTELLAEAARYGGDLSQDVTQVLAILVHDMKNAFSFIQSWSEGLRAGGKDAARSVTRIRDNISRLRDSARDAETMLSLNSELRITFEDASQVTEGILASLQASADQKRISIVRFYQPGMPRVPVDRGRLESLIANLAKNSLEATVAGGLVEVCVSTDEAKTLLRVVVRDSGECTSTDAGSSIAAASLPKKGTGVGLMAAKRIASSHGGTLSLEPRVEGGMIATFEMPLGDEERLFAQEFPFRDELGEESTKAIRASIHFRVSGDEKTSDWLLVKALEAETLLRLSARLSSPVLAPIAVQWTKGAVKARTLSPTLVAHLEAYAADIAIDEGLLDEMKLRAVPLLSEIGRGQWDMDCSKHLEVSVLLAVFCIRAGRHSSVPAVVIPTLGGEGASQLAGTYAQIHLSGDPQRTREACRESLRLLSTMRNYVSGAGGGGVT